MSPRKSDSPLQGVLLVDKPAGWTSHDVVARVRRLTGQRRIGHTGTLDPAATGLLVLCLGSATRLVEYLTAHDKRYTGEICLGTTTDTLDAEGNVTAVRPVAAVDEALLSAIAMRFTGRQLQVPPAYSAIKVDGQRSYARARAGDSFELPAREVEVTSLALALLSRGILGFDVSCGSGTYIRSLARDIGEALGCGAHLASLRRHRVGVFAVEDAAMLDEIAAACAAGAAQDLLIPADEGLAGSPAGLLSPAGSRLFLRGIRRSVAGAPGAHDCIRVYDDLGAFLGVGSLTAGGELRPVKVFAGPPDAPSATYVGGEPENP